MLTDKYFAYLQLERFWEPTSWMNRPVTVVRSQPRERPPPAPGPTSGPLRPLKIKKVSFVSFLWANVGITMPKLGFSENGFVT